MKQSRITRILFTLISLCICIGLIFCAKKYSFAQTTFNLTATAKPAENSNRGAVDLDWSSYSGENVIFKGYQKRDNAEEWSSISLMDYEQVKEVKVLQIYPDTGAGQLKKWMETDNDNGEVYGKGIIKVSDVSITDFNTNPSAYLKKDGSGQWNYDVIFFGTADRNGCRDLSQLSYNVVDQYIDDGYGCIFGHDTILNNSYFVNDTKETSSGPVKQGQGYFDKLANEHFKSLKFGSTQNGQLYYGGSEVKIVKNGLFTTYPWPIGEIGTTLQIPNTHTWGQVVNEGYEDNIWLRFTAYGDEGYNFYLITENNVSMIQTGHSGGTATPDEEKIIANLIFSSYQISSNTSTIDRSAMDYAAPTTPTINVKEEAGNVTIDFSSEEQGTDYTYKVEAYDKLNYDEIKATSNEPTVKVTSGFDKFYYIIDDKADNDFNIKDVGATPTQEGSSKVNIQLEYNSNAKKYIHIKAVDKAGNESAVVTKQIIDEIAPTITVNPDTCEWKPNETVNLKFTDQGGSGFKEYTYAVTDSRDSEQKNWENAAQSEESTVILTTEGQTYLHVKATDNEGNSKEEVFGPYKIDNSKPEVNVSGNFETSTTDPIEFSIHSQDNLSGLKEVRFNGQTFQGQEDVTAQVTTNGLYRLEVEDIAGNIYIKDILVENIYKHCDANLDHPDYSTDKGKCPICEAYEGLEVREESNNVIYNATEQHIKYENPSKATIIEYYNDGKQAPVEVGSYDYELKVSFEGEEYKTGITGKITISPKQITIEDINGVNREYNGTNIVALQGGNLVGVEEQDLNEVSFTLPENGTIKNKNVGKYYVMIPEISLQGEKAKNYTLSQPKMGSSTVEIFKKGIENNDIKVVGITAENREYDGTDRVLLKGGELLGIEECDYGKVSFILPEVGTIESKNVGEYKVTIPKIVLTGLEAENYEITQPEDEDLSVIISKRKLTIDYVKGIDRKYDGTDLVEIKSGEIQNVIDDEDVKVIVPKKGIAQNSHVGTWTVEIEPLALEGEDAQNYEIIQPNPEDITVNILKPDQPVLHVEPYISKINNEELTETIPVTFFEDDADTEEIKIKYKKEELKEKIRYADNFTITIRVYNEGIGTGYAQNITNIIPEGLEFVEDNEINKEYKWKKTKDNTVVTDYLGFDSGEENELNVPTDEKVDYRDVLLFLDVTEKNKLKNKLKDKSTVEAVDMENEPATENVIKQEIPIVEEAIAENGWKNKEKSVTIKAKDEAQKGIAGYAITKENEIPQEWINCTEETWTSDAIYDEGTYYAWVKDQAGNISESKEFEVNKIDKESPIITDFNKETITLIGKAHDTKSGICAYQFSKENVDENQWNLIYYPTTDEINKIQTVTEAGTYYFYVKDQAGNVTRSETPITITEEEIYNQTEKEVSVTFNYFGNTKTVKGIVLKGRDSAIIVPPKVENINVEIYGQTVSATPRGWSRQQEANAEIEVELGQGVDMPKSEDSRTYYMSYDYTVKYGVNLIDNQTNKVKRETKQIELNVNSQGQVSGEETKLDLPTPIAPAGWTFNGWTRDEDDPNGTTINVETERPDPIDITQYHASYKKEITVERHIYKNQTMEPTLSGTVYKNDEKTNTVKFILGEIASIQITEDENGEPLPKAETAEARGWSTSPDKDATIEIPSNNTTEIEFSESAVYYASYSYGNKYTFIGPDGTKTEGSSGTNVDYLGNKTSRESVEDQFPELPQAPSGWSPRGWVKGTDAKGEIVDTENQKPETNVEYYATYKKNITVNRYVYLNNRLEQLTGVAYKNYVQEIPASIELGTTENIQINVDGNGNTLDEPIQGTPRFWSTSSEANAPDTTAENSDSSVNENSVALGGTAHLLKNATYYMSYNYQFNMKYNDGESDKQEGKNPQIAYDGKTKGDEFDLPDPTPPSSWGEGWEFNGWTKDDEDPNQEPVHQDKEDKEKSDKIDPDAKYKAGFKKLITITYNENTGVPPVPEPQTGYIYKNCDKEIPLTIEIPKTVVPTKDGFYFRGWSDVSSDSTSKYDLGKTYDFLESKILYAVWDEQDRVGPQIAFDPDGSEIWKKSHSTTVTVTDNATNMNENGIIRSLWSTDSNQPSESSISDPLTSGTELTKNNVTGKYYLWVYAEDESGNKNIQRSEAFFIDNVNPNITNTTTEHEVSSDKGIKITGTAKDENSGIVAYGFSKDNPLDANQSEGWTSLLESTTQDITQEKYVTQTGKWYFNVKDAAGNSSSREIDVKKEYFNNLAPKINYELKNPVNNWAKSATVTITYPTFEGITKTYTRSDNGGAEDSYTAPFEVTQNNTRITAKSKFGDIEVEADPVTITKIDNTPPQVVFNEGEDESCGTIQIKDNECGMLRYEFKYEGENAGGRQVYPAPPQEAQIVDCSSSYGGGINFNFTYSNVYLRNCTITLTAYDRLENKTVQTKQVNIEDLIPPVISLVENSIEYKGKENCPECNKPSNVFECKINYSDEGFGVPNYSTEDYLGIQNREESDKITGHLIYLSVPELKSKSGQFYARSYIHEEENLSGSGNLYITLLDLFWNKSNELTIPYNFTQ